MSLTKEPKAIKINKRKTLRRLLLHMQLTTLNRTTRPLIEPEVMRTGTSQG